MIVSEYKRKIKNIELSPENIEVVTMRSLETQFKNSLGKTVFKSLTEYALGQVYNRIMNQVKSDNKTFGIEKKLKTIKSKL